MRRALKVLVPLVMLLVVSSCVPQWVRDRIPAGWGPACLRTIDEETLRNLTLSMDSTVQMRPGETREFSLGVVECCYFFEPVDACASWSVSPSEGASINAQTGVLAVDPQTPDGSVFTVSADVEDGRREVSIDVHVYTPEDNPLVGIWKEEAQIACDSGEDVIPAELIGELRFRADGTFGVTWMPFEVYVDYWGTYAYDSDQGTLDLFVTGGNNVPDDVDGSGLFSIDQEGRLILTGMWLGTPHGGLEWRNCGHRFL